jgi:hypothetical protein
MAGKSVTDEKSGQKSVMTTSASPFPRDMPVCPCFPLILSNPIPATTIGIDLSDRTFQFCELNAAG